MAGDYLIEITHYIDTDEFSFMIDDLSTPAPVDGYLRTAFGYDITSVDSIKFIMPGDEIGSMIIDNVRVVQVPECSSLTLLAVLALMLLPKRSRVKMARG